MRFSILLAALVLSACSAPARITQIPGYTETYAIDFTPYTSQGFLMTPEAYDGPYESIGLLRVVVWPPGARGEDEVQRLGEGRTRRQLGEWQFQDVTVDDALRDLHQEAVDLGADAIIRVETLRVDRTLAVGPLDQVVHRGVEVSGFAIRRLDR